jgi:hypothetical protein
MSRPLEDVKLTTRLNQYGIYSVIRYLEQLLQGLSVPDYQGAQIESLVQQNVSVDTAGNVTIKINTLEHEVEILPSSSASPSIWLRNHAGTLQWSNDHETWQEWGTGSSGGSGDMTKAVYDTTNNGLCDAAERLSDGANSATAAQVHAHLNNAASHYQQSEIDHTVIQNRGGKTHAEIDAHLADTALHAGGTLPSILALSAVDDPSGEATVCKMHGKTGAVNGNAATIPAITLSDGTHELIYGDTAGKLPAERVPGLYQVDLLPTLATEAPMTDGGKGILALIRNMTSDAYELRVRFPDGRDVKVA